MGHLAAARCISGVRGVMSRVLRGVDNRLLLIEMVRAAWSCSRSMPSTRTPLTSPSPVMPYLASMPFPSSSSSSQQSRPPRNPQRQILGDSESFQQRLRGIQALSRTSHSPYENSPDTALLLGSDITTWTLHMDLFSECSMEIGRCDVVLDDVEDANSCQGGENGPSKPFLRDARTFPSPTITELTMTSPVEVWNSFGEIAACGINIFDFSGAELDPYPPPSYLMFTYFGTSSLSVICIDRILMILPFQSPT
jgi:hypothetical protein